MSMFKNYSKVRINQDNFDLNGEILYEICLIAEKDQTAKSDCFSTEWVNNSASVLYQVKKGIMSVDVIKNPTNVIGMCGFSIHDDILFCPRRAYIIPDERNKNIITKYIMRDLEKEYYDVINYVLTSFNNTKRGKTHFSFISKNRLYKVVNDDPYFLDFKEISSDVLSIMYTKQFAIYKKIHDVPDLSIEKAIKLLNP